MRAHSEEQKANALRIVAESGLAEAWRQTGIPKPTIAGWAKAAGIRTFNAGKTTAATEAHIEYARELRERLRVALLEKAADLLDRMDAPHVEFKGKDADQVEYPIAPANAVQAYATSVGILIDKYRLESGEATARTESRTLTDGLNDHEKATLRDAIDSFLAAHPDPASDPV